MVEARKGITMVVGEDGKKRCFGTDDKPYMRDYHDKEWGTPSHNDKHLFEMLVLEGAQAGLSWQTVLKKRPSYRKAFFLILIPRKWLL